jgi:hypothetical protein
VSIRKIQTNRPLLVAVGLSTVALAAAFTPIVGKSDGARAYLFTETPKYEPTAWLDGKDRFPSGASITVVSGQTRRKLAPDFFASADATVSYDGSRVLFSGKRSSAERWQIWEIDLNGGPVRRVTHLDSDCIRPLYLPTGEIVYTRVSATGTQIEVNGKQVTFAPGRHMTDDILRDGRILFEAARAPNARELYTVYPDGTGVEALRCDHGPDRGDARQLASGEYIFRSGNRLARIVSAQAGQIDVPQPIADGTGPIAEISAGVWLVSLRTKGGNLGLFQWTSAAGESTPLETPVTASAVQPVVIAPRTPPREFPSALVPARTAGNLLCLNSRISRTPMNGAGVRSVRLYTQDAHGKPALLGQTAVERDGSFYIQVPPDRPLRIDLADADGHSIRGETGWFWMRPSEQRICVGCHTGPERAPENKVPDILLRTIDPVKMLEVQP